MPPLLSFSGRVARRGYVGLQLVSALLLVAGIVLAYLSVGFATTVGADGQLRLELAAWAAGGTLVVLTGSLLVGAGAVTRRARDGALPAIFIGLFYVINRLLLPVNVGIVTLPGMRGIALQFTYIMIIVQILLVVRGTMPDPERRRSAEQG